MENLDQPAETVVLPPPPPPPPQDVVQQARYVPPVVVDSVKPEETLQLMTADQAQIEVQDEEIVEVVRVVKTLPKFKPGKQGGKPVSVWYTIPINFQLK